MTTFTKFQNSIITIVSSAMSAEEKFYGQRKIAAAKVAETFNSTCKTAEDVGARRKEATEALSPEGQQMFRNLWKSAVEQGLKLHGWTHAKANTGERKSPLDKVENSSRKRITSLLNQYASLSEEERKVFRSMMKTVEE